MGIPLVALGVRPPEQPDILGQQQKAVQLRNMMQSGQQAAAMAPGQQQIQQQQIQAGQQQNQMGALQLQDAQTLRQLSPQFVTKDESGKVTGYDFNGFLNAARTSGVNPATLNQMQTQQLEVQKNILGLSDSQRAAQQSQNKAGYEMLEGLRGVKDPAERQVSYSQGLANLQKQGVDVSKLPAQAPTDEQLPQYEVPLGIHAQLLADAKTKSDLAKNEAELPGQVAESKIKQQQAAGQVMTGPMADSKYRNVKQSESLGLKVSPEDKAFVQAYEKQKTLNPITTFNLQNAGATGTPGKPSAIAQALADGSMKWQDAVSMRTPFSVKQALLTEVKGIKPDFNSGDFALEQGVKKEFTSGDAAKSLTSFNTAIEHAKQLGQAANALDNNNFPLVNKLTNALGYQTGSDKTTNFNVIKNALTGEISKVFKGGGATDAEIEAVQGPFSAANSPAQLKGAVNNAVQLMNSKRDALQQQYQQGIQARPNFGGPGNAPQKFTIGQKVTIKGIPKTITAVHPDGSFDAK